MRAIEPGNSQLRTIEFSIFKSRNNGGRRPKGRDPVCSSDMHPTLWRDKKRLCEGSLEEAGLTGRHNLRRVLKRRALQAEKKRRCSQK